MRIKRSAAAAALVLLLGAGGCGRGSEAEVVERATVVALDPADVAVARIEDVGAGVTVTGTLNPYRIVEVRAQVPGVLSDLRVDRGDAVGQGVVLARIEAEGIRGQAASAQAAVASAQAGLALARRQLESAEKLYAAGAMSAIEFEQARAAHAAAEAQLAATRAVSAGAGESARRATVTAPIQGEISARTVSEGEAVNVGQALFTVVDARTLELAGQVPAVHAIGIRAGMAVEFTIDAIGGRVFHGTVARVEPTADPATRQVGVYVRLPNADRGLVGGLFATGRIITGSTSQAVVIPVAALREEAGQPFVWLVRDGRTVKQPVTPGVRDEARGVVQIVDGLEGGEQLIATPGEVAEGMEVRVEGSAAPAAGEVGR
jgi:RND family efflux transporter MFP subunit